MSDWTAGYVAEIAYTFGYYHDLDPMRLRLAFLKAGLVFPEVGTACELGFGQGVSANIHAAASGVQWFGTDFNPAHAGFARELATVSGADLQLFDQAFAEFCNRTDLPDFDFIGLHGIWSWISEENRSVIVDFVRRRLKVGGVLLVSYNTLPGLATMVPMQHLLKRHHEVMGSPGGGLVSGIDASMAFAEKLFAANPWFTRVNPHVPERFQIINKQDRNYLVHEYFNGNWKCLHFAEMADLLSRTKLNYACSANYLDAVDALNLSAEQQVLVNEISDPLFRETVRDFCVNQQFRRDYWVNGARRLTPLEQAEKLRAERVVLLAAREDVSFVASGALGEVGLQEQVYGPILDALADHRPKTLGEIEVELQDRQINLVQLVEAVMVLGGKGVLTAAQDDAAISRARPQTDKLNAYLCKKAMGSSDIIHLASPVTGGAVAVGRVQQLFLLADAGGKESSRWAEFAWQLLAGQGLKLTKDNVTLETDEENLAELNSLALLFVEKRLPILKALGVA